MSMPLDCGQARSSPSLRRRAISGRRSKSIRTISRNTPTAIPATLSGRAGSFRSAKRLFRNAAAIVCLSGGRTILPRDRYAGRLVEVAVLGLPIDERAVDGFAVDLRA